MRSLFRYPPPIVKEDEPCWRIERAHIGGYYNSPRVWLKCGVIRAPDREAASIRAILIVGSAIGVRVTPA